MPTCNESHSLSCTLLQLRLSPVAILSLICPSTRCPQSQRLPRREPSPLNAPHLARAAGSWQNSIQIGVSRYTKNRLNRHCLRIGSMIKIVDQNWLFQGVCCFGPHGNAISTKCHHHHNSNTKTKRSKLVLSPRHISRTSMSWPRELSLKPQDKRL